MVVEAEQVVARLQGRAVVELQDLAGAGLHQDQVALLHPDKVVAPLPGQTQVALPDNRLQHPQIVPHSLLPDLLQVPPDPSMVAHKELRTEKLTPIRQLVTGPSIRHVNQGIRARAQIVKQALQEIEPETEMGIGQEVPQVLGQVVMAEEIPE